MAACVEIEEELSAYLDGEVAPEMRASIDEHLRTCAACQAVLTELKSIHNVLSDLPKLKAPAALASAIHNEIAAAPAAVTAAPAKAASAKIDKSIDWSAATPPKQSAWAPLAFGIAAMVVLCLLAFVVVPAIMKNRPGELSMKTPATAPAAARTPESQVATEGLKKLDGENKSFGAAKLEKDANASRDIALLEEQKEALDRPQDKGGFAEKAAPGAAGNAKSAGPGKGGGGSGDLRYKSLAENAAAAQVPGAANAPTPAPPALQPQRESKRAEASAQDKQRQDDPGATVEKNAELRKSALAEADRVAQKPLQEAAKAARQLEQLQKADEAAGELKAKSNGVDGKKDQVASNAAPKPFSEGGQIGAPAAPAASLPPQAPAPVKAPPAPRVATIEPAKDARKDEDLANRKQAGPADNARPEAEAAAVADAAPKEDAVARRRGAAPEAQKKSAEKEKLADTVLVFQTANPEQLMKQIQALAEASGGRVDLLNQNRNITDKATAGELAYVTGKQPAEVSVRAAAGQRENLLSKLRVLQAQLAETKGPVAEAETQNALGGGKAAETNLAKPSAAAPAKKSVAAADATAATAAPASKAETATVIAGAPVEEPILIRIIVLPAGVNAKAKAVDK